MKNDDLDKRFEFATISNLEEKACNFLLELMLFNGLFKRD